MVRKWKKGPKWQQIRNERNEREAAKAATKAANRATNSSQQKDRAHKAALNINKRKNRTAALNKEIGSMHNAMEGVVDKSFIQQAMNSLNKNPDTRDLTDIAKRSFVMNDAKRMQSASNFKKSSGGEFNLTQEAIDEYSKGAGIEDINKKIQSAKKSKKESAAASSTSTHQSAFINRGNRPQSPGASQNSQQGNSQGSQGSHLFDTKGMDTVERHMVGKLNNKISSIDGMRGSNPLSLEEAQSFSKGFKFKDEATSEKFANKIHGGNYDDAIQMAKGNKNSFVESAGVWDKARAYKAPELAAGGLGTAWLVSNMASSKGQQSNAQLYGQQQPYY